VAAEFGADRVISGELVVSGYRFDASIGWVRVTRVGLISDIHGNAVALGAVVADLARRRVDRVVCLGDLAAGGPQPREVIMRLRELGCAAVRGNADGWLLDGLPPGSSEATRRLGEIVSWTRGLLSPDERAYLAALPPTLRISIGDWTLLCFHGSPRSDVDALLPETPIAALDLLLADPPAGNGFACGHTHLQFFRPHRHRVLLNPGSVGLPLDSLAPTERGWSLPAWAEYALIEVDGSEVEVVFRRVPVDTDALATATEAMPQATWASDLERRITRWNARALA
jgi:putative phosphoesterase